MYFCGGDGVSWCGIGEGIVGGCVRSTLGAARSELPW